MKIGTLEIKKCNDCPGYTWKGESRSGGDQGCFCKFGAFWKTDQEEKQVPPNCPFRVFRDQIKILKGE